GSMCTATATIRWPWPAGCMKQREIEHDGETYRCEWHGKKERHRNRVHFSLPDQRLEGRVLIGIFVDHLDT
ncbi:hypothetical protein ACWC5G_34865, partial [Streptomyces sp. NPDC001274]